MDLPSDEEGPATARWEELLSEDGTLVEVIEEETQEAQEMKGGCDQELCPEVQPEKRTDPWTMDEIIEHRQVLIDLGCHSY